MILRASAAYFIGVGLGLATIVAWWIFDARRIERAERRLIGLRYNATSTERPVAAPVTPVHREQDASTVPAWFTTQTGFAP